MSTSTFQAQAAQVAASLSGSLPRSPTTFARLAAEIAGTPRMAQEPSEHDAEWQRVNSYIADVLKDAHVLYAKLARLQGDFIGGELNELEKISSSVLELGEKLSLFMKAFHDGDASMMKEKTFGGGDGSGGGAPPGTPPPQIPNEFKRPEKDFETELDLEGDGDDFKGFEEEDSEDQGQGQDQQ